MKKLVHFICICFLVVCSSYSQEGWYQQQSATKYLHSSICFINRNTGWAVTDYGDIIQTTDGGYTWEKIAYIYAILFDVQFIDQMNGWISNSDGNIYRTTDGGINWTEPDSSAYIAFRKHYFIDSLRGWAVGLYGEIGHTTDGGLNWYRQNSPTSAYLGGVHFTDTLKGWAVGDSGVVLHTYNGGANWLIQNSNIQTKTIIDIVSTDSLNVWAVGDSGLIIHTTNGGLIWSNQTSQTNSFIFGISFVDSLKGWAVGDSGIILHTTNGGNNWNKQTSGTNHRLLSVYFVDSLNGWASGFGVILHTSNGGITFCEEEAIVFQESLCRPNPATDFIEISYSMNKGEVDDVRIYNVFGEEVNPTPALPGGEGVRQVLPSGEDLGGVVRMEVSALPAGVYFVRVGTQMQKFIKI